MAADAGSRKVFISHRGCDTKTQFCLWLAPDLWRAGMDAFVDEDGLQLGDRADEKMMSELESAAIVLVVLSPHFFESRWCMKELRCALQLKKACSVFYGVELDAAECKQTAERLAKEAGKCPPWEESGLTCAEWGAAIEEVIRLTELRLSDYKNRPDLLRTQVVDVLAKRLEIALPRVRDNLPLLPDARFTGRDSELAKLEEKLGQAVCVSGMPGLGKTHLVSEYAYRHLHEYDLVLWVTAGDAERTVAAYSALASFLQLPKEAGQQEQELVATSVKTFLEQSGKRCLLIFDNAESEEAVRKWLPHRGFCHTIITTRLSGCFSYCEALVLGTLDWQEAMALMRGALNPTEAEEQALRDGCEELQQLTFAIRIASSILARGVLPSELLAMLRRQRARAYDNLAKEEDTFGRNPSLAALFDESFASLKRYGRRASALAFNLVIVGAWFAPVAVPVPLLAAAAAALSNEPAKQEELYLEAVSMLVEYSLASRNVAGGSVSFHRLLRLYGQEKFGSLACEAMVSAVQEVGDVEKHLEHFDQACTWVFHEPESPVEIADEAMTQFIDKVCFELAFHHVTDTNQLAKAQSLLNCSFERLSEGTPKWWRGICIKGHLVQHQGQADKAERLHRQALEGRQATLGPMHPETMRSLEGLAILLLDQGRYAEAEEMERLTLKRRQLVLGETHQHTLNSMMNLAVMLTKIGRHAEWAEAEKLLRCALDRMETIRGPMDSRTLGIVDNLAHVVRKQGWNDEAESLNRRALVGREVTLGPLHSSTLASINNLGASILNLRRFAEAEQLFRRAFEGKKATWGPKSFSTLQSANNLAIAIGAQGQYLEAERMHRCILEEQEVLRGPMHEDTLRTVDTLGIAMLNQGRYFEAADFFRRAFEGWQAIFSPTHSETLTSMEYLAKFVVQSKKHRPYTRCNSI